MSSVPANLMLIATGGVDGWVSVNDVTGVVPNSAAFIYDHDSGPLTVVINSIDVPGNRLLLWANGSAINASSYTVGSGSALSFPGSSSYLNPSVPALAAPYVLSGTTDTVPFTINGVLNQTAKLQSWEVAGVEKSYMTADGALVAPVQPHFIDLGTVSGDVTIDIGKADYYSLRVNNAYTKILFTNSVLTNGPKAIQLRVENGSYVYPVSYDANKGYVNSNGNLLRYIDGKVRVISSNINSFPGLAGAETSDFVTWTPRMALGGQSFTPTRSLWANNLPFLLSGSASLNIPARYSLDDGLTWIPAATNFNGIFTSIIWDGTRYVALSSFNGVYAIYTSTTLPNWTKLANLPFIASMTYSDIAWNGSMYAVVTNAASPNTIHTSPDGINWTNRVTTGTASLNRIIWAGSQWVAVGATGKIFTSPDGTTWTPQVSGSTSALTAIFYVNGILYTTISGVGSHYMSTNGVTWTTKANNGNGVWDLIWTGSSYVLLSLTGQMLATPDLLNTAWTEVGLGSWNTNTLVASTGTIFFWGSTLQSGGVYMALKSSDGGATWKKILPINNGVSGAYLMLEKSGTMIAANTSGVYYSTNDGDTWSLSTALVSNVGSFSGLASVTSNLFLLFNSTAIANNSFPTTGKMSRDGIAWVDLPIGGNTGGTFGVSWVSAAADAAGHVVVVGNASCALLSSDSGTNWTLGNTGNWAGSNVNFTNVVWDSVGSQFIAWGANSGSPSATSLIATSADFGATWTQYALPSDLAVGNLSRYLRASNTHFFLSNSNSECWVTPDFVSWNKQTSPITPQNVLSWDGTNAVGLQSSNGPWVTASPLLNGTHWGSPVRFAGGTRTTFTSTTLYPVPVDLLRVVYDPTTSSYVVSTLVANVKP